MAALNGVGNLAWWWALLLSLTFNASAIAAEGKDASEEDTKTEAKEASPAPSTFDVVLLVDASSEMAGLSRKSAHVVTEAMSDAHRLAIMTFGKEVRVLQTLSRIATVQEKTAALQTLADAAFDATEVDLTLGLDHALEHLEKRAGKQAEKVVILLAGKTAAAGDADAVKTDVAPRYLEKGVVLHVITLPNEQVSLLQAAANLSGGKCLAAVNVETMTDALDVLVERLSAPERVVVTKEVPVAAPAVAPKEIISPDKHLEDIKRDTRAYFITGSFSAVIILLLVLVLFQLHRLRKGTDAPEKAPVRVEQKGERSGFAKLRDLSNSLGNLIVDAKEMSEALNLDLEDFGVETWKEKKALGAKYRDFAGSIFLVMDHLEVQADSAQKKEGAKWAVEKLKRTLEEEGIEEIAVEKGDPFDNLYHKHAEERVSDLKPGTVLDVMRKGYLKREGKDGKDVFVLRQAEVAVSQGTIKDETPDASRRETKEAQ